MPGRSHHALGIAVIATAVAALAAPAANASFPGMHERRRRLSRRQPAW